MQWIVCLHPFVTFIDVHFDSRQQKNAAEEELYGTYSLQKIKFNDVFRNVLLVLGSNVGKYATLLPSSNQHMDACTLEIKVIPGFCCQIGVKQFCRGLITSEHIVPALS